MKNIVPESKYWFSELPPHEIKRLLGHPQTPEQWILAEIDFLEKRLASLRAQRRLSSKPAAASPKASKKAAAAAPHPSPK